MKPTICLAMIVKNEAHCIRRCLESVRPYIHRFAIVDTGSTDRTEQIILDTISNVPGQITSKEWVDFSTNRNQALELAREQKCDYILMLDADDYLECDNPNFADELRAQVYHVQFRHSNIYYRRPQLFRSSLQAEYQGVLHEYLATPPGRTSQDLDGVRIIFGANGARSRDPNKYLHDCQVFEDALAKEPNNERSWFYYGQSLRDAGMHDKAIMAYFKRFKMDGWIEEKYISMLEMAKMYQNLNPSDWQTVEQLYLTAYQTLPTRAESMHYLALYFRNRKDFTKAYLYANQGLSDQHATEGLFIETACAEWKLKDEAAVSAFWCNRKSEALQLNLQLIQSGKVPAQDLNRIQQNLGFCQ